MVKLVVKAFQLLLGLNVVFFYGSVSAAENLGNSTEIIRPAIDYRLVPPRQIDQVTDLTQLQKVADIEIFYWYGCADCLKVENQLDEYLAKFPELTVKRTPLVAFPAWRAQAYLQPLLAQLEGKVQTPSKQEIYRQCIEDCSFFESYESTLAWLKAKYQINQMPTINEAEIWRAEKKFRERAESFSISQVPTIIIKEQYITDANAAKTTQRLIAIVDHLLNQ